LHLEEVIFKPQIDEILKVMPFSVIRRDVMKTENISTAYEKGRKFLQINETRTYLSPSKPDDPLDIDEEVLEISEQLYKNRLYPNDRALLLVTFSMPNVVEHQEFDRTIIEQVAGNPMQEPDSVSIREKFFNPRTHELKEPVINIASEVDHISDVILSTTREDCYMT